MRNPSCVRACTLAAAIVIASAPAFADASNDGLCGPFDLQHPEVPSVTGDDTCREPGLVAPPRSQVVAPGIVALPTAEAGARPSVRSGEALLALPKDADGAISTDFELGAGARVVDSFFSPVLCASVARVVGEEGATPEQLVVRLPRGAAVLPHTVYATASQEVRAFDTETEGRKGDPYRRFQYGLNQIEIERAWTVSDGEGAVIALLDSAPDASHGDLPDLPALSELPALDEVSLEADGDGSGTRVPGTHGTLMAGVLSARRDNGLGIVGVAPGARLLSIAVCRAEAGLPDDCGLYDILRGLDRAWREEADVVNLSVTGPSNPLLERAVARLERLGVVVVAASGNEGSQQPRYPAAYPSVVGVGAVDVDGKAYARGNTGLSVEVLAPGVEILSTVPGDSYAFASGTSLAAAHVSGAFALLRAAEKQPERLREAVIAVGRSRQREPGDGPVALEPLCSILAVLGAPCSP